MINKKEGTPQANDNEIVNSTSDINKTRIISKCSVTIDVKQN